MGTSILKLKRGVPVLINEDRHIENAPFYHYLVLIRKTHLEQKLYIFVTETYGNMH